MVSSSKGFVQVYYIYMNIFIIRISTNFYFLDYITIQEDPGLWVGVPAPTPVCSLQCWPADHICLPHVWFGICSQQLQTSSRHYQTGKFGCLITYCISEVYNVFCINSGFHLFKFQFPPSLECFLQCFVKQLQIQNMFQYHISLILFSC